MKIKPNGYHKTRQIDKQTNRQRDRLSRSYKKYHERKR